MSASSATYDGDYRFQREAYIRSDDIWLDYDVVDLDTEFPEPMYHILNNGITPKHAEIGINGCFGSDGYFRWWDYDDIDGRKFENTVLDREGLVHPDTGHLQIQVKFGKPYKDIDWEKDIPYGYVSISHSNSDLRDKLVSLILDLKIVDSFQLHIFFTNEKVRSDIEMEFSGTVGSYRKFISSEEP